MSDKEELKQVLLDKIKKLSAEFEKPDLTVDQKVKLANSISQIILAYNKLCEETQEEKIEEVDLSPLLKELPKKYKERILRFVKSRRPGEHY